VNVSQDLEGFPSISGGYEGSVGDEPLGGGYKQKGALVKFKGSNLSCGEHGVIRLQEGNCDPSEFSKMIRFG
jgi:hypothetical protein